MFWSRKNNIKIIDNVEEVLNEEKVKVSETSQKYLDAKASSILIEFSEFLCQNNKIGNGETCKSFTYVLKPNLDISLKIEHFDYGYYYGRYIKGSVYLNDVKIIPHTHLSGYIPWCDWVVEAGKQEAYSKAIGLLKPILNNLKEEKERYRKAIIIEKVNKVGL